MSLPSHPIVVIPARMASSRLPGKPLADIHGQPMVVQVMNRALEADIGPVVVACAEREIADAVIAAGGHAVLTDPDLPSGSDRVHQALSGIDPDARHDAVINVQGDLPTIDPAVIRMVFSPLGKAKVDIATLACVIKDPASRDDPNVVKAVLSVKEGATAGRALYFSRAAVPPAPGPLYHHIGLYAFRREALNRFVNMAPGVLEQREKLEQLRALENGMRIDAALVDTAPLGVDTPAELERARDMLAGRHRAGNR